MNSDSLSGQSMWLQNSIHLPASSQDNTTTTTNSANSSQGNNNSSSDSFAAPDQLSSTNSFSSGNSQQQQQNRAFGTFRRGGNRLPSLALCADYSLGGFGENSSASANTTPRGSTLTSTGGNARASVAGAHSQQLFALQEQVNLAKASTEDLKSELATLQARVETEAKTAKRWQDRAEQEEKARVAAEKKLQDARFSDNGEMGSLREELAALDQALRDERRKSAAQKADAIRQLTDQFEQERENQEKWWKESAVETATRIANLEQIAAASSAFKRDLEVAQRNEADLRGHVEALRAELDNSQSSFEMELRQQAMQLKDDNTRALLKQEDEFLLRVNALEKDSASRVNSFREKIAELQDVARSVESVKRDLQSAQSQAKEREAELNLLRRQTATSRAQMESEHEQEMERVADEHKTQVELLVSEHNDEMGKMRARVATAATLNERCNRLEKLANEHLTTSQKHEAELQAVLAQLGDLQRANICLEQERDEWKNKCYASEETLREREQESERRIQTERAERENQCRSLQQSLEQLSEEHREMEDEYEANLEGMLARISTMETTFAQQEAAWQKERMNLRVAQGESRRTELENSENVNSLQSTISMLQARVDEAQNQIHVARRERDAALNQLGDVKAQISEQQRITSKSEVDLAAAKSTVRALETRLEVVRAGSVAASVSMAGSSQQQHQQQFMWNQTSSSSSSSNINNNSFSGFSGLPSFSLSSSNNMMNTKPGQVVEIADANQINDNNNNDNDNNNNNDSQDSNLSQRSYNQNNNNNIKSAIVSRSGSCDTSLDKEKILANRSAASALADSTNLGKIAGSRRGRNNNNADDCSNISSCSSSQNTTAKRSSTTNPMITCDKVFAFTGFDPSEVQTLQREVESLGARVVECKANSVPPTETTHLVSNGLMTMKLLVTLSRGSWVVPSAYIHQSVAARRFVDESSNGGVRHDAPFFSGIAVALSPAFLSSRHATTASTVIAEGGAAVVDTSASSANDAETELAHLVEAALSLGGGNGVWPKLGGKNNNNKHKRMLICTSQEASEIKEYLQSSTSGGNNNNNNKKNGGNSNNANNNNNNNNKDLLDVCTWDSVLKRLYPQEELRA